MSPWSDFKGEPVASIDARSEDAGCILDGDDPEDGEWFYAEVPQDWLPSTDSPLVDEEKRNVLILGWVDKSHAGDWLAALRKSPLLVLLGDKKQVDLLDGWHRLKLARQVGTSVIPVCFAIKHQREKEGRVE